MTPYWNATTFRTGGVTSMSLYRFFVMIACGMALQVLPAMAGPVEALLPGEWYEVPNSNVSAINPCPANNCNYSGAPGQKSVILAWSGGAYDTKRDRLILWGGGHGDYGGNEIYGFDVNTLKWIMLTKPSTNIADGEVYPDGRPSSRHTYGGLLYLANVDKLWASNGSVWENGGCSTGTWMYDFSASPPESGWARQTDYPGDAKCGAVSAYDPATGLVWFNGKAGLQTFNPANMSSPWVQRNQEGSVPLYMSGAIDVKRQKLVMIGGGYAFIHDISQSGTVARQNLAALGATEIESANAPGLAYDPVSDRIVAWNGGASIYTLNMDTLVWERRAPASSNTVTPPQVTAAGGTFGRFQYMPFYNAFIAVNATSENVYIYRLSAGTGSPPPQRPGKPTVTVR